MARVPIGTLKTTAIFEKRVGYTLGVINERIKSALEYESNQLAERARRKAPERKAFYGERKTLAFMKAGDFGKGAAGMRVRKALEAQGIFIKPAGVKGMTPSSQFKDSNLRGQIRFATKVVKSNVGRKGGISRELEPVVDLAGAATGRYRFSSPAQRNMATSRTIREVERGRAQWGHEARGQKNQSPVQLRYKGVGAHQSRVVGAVYGGRLKREIVSRGVSEVRPGIYEATIVSPTPYAKFVEFPTRRTAAQPYMIPALNMSRRTLPTTIRRYMERGK